MAMVFPTSPIVGQVFTSGGRSWVWNGSTWDSPARDNPTIVSGLQQVLYYTSSGTFTKATYPWLRAIRVRMVGGGGGGCGASAAGATELSTGNGGSGAAYAESFITDIAGLPSSVAVTIGAGGSGGAISSDGSNGGTSSFSSLVSAPGGNGGARFLVTAFPEFRNTTAGATGAVGDTTQDGGPSKAFVATGIGLRGAVHGGGGASYFGDGPEQRQTAGASGGVGQTGPSAVNYGAGGGGAHARAGATSGSVGGAGAPGIVIVELYA